MCPRLHGTLVVDPVIEPGSPVCKLTFPFICHAALHSGQSSGHCELAMALSHLGTEGPHSLDPGHCPWFILRRQGCRIDLSYEKGASVSELVSSSKQDSQGRRDLSFPLCTSQTCSLGTHFLLPYSWSRPWTETHHNKDWHREQISPEAVVLAMEAKTFFYKPSDLSGFNSLLESAFPWDSVLSNHLCQRL